MRLVNLYIGQSSKIRTYTFELCYSHFSDCSLTSLNYSDLRGCLTERTVVHTPPNQDGRATPSPEHVLSADGEEMNSFDDNHSSLPRDIHSSISHTISNTSTHTNKNTKETENTDENFNSFRYWRSPLPDISGELEMLNYQKSSDVVEKEEKEEVPENNYLDSKPSPGKSTSDQIQKVLDCLQPHMDDPDVQGGYTEPLYVDYL